MSVVLGNGPRLKSPADYSSTHGSHVSHFGVLKAGPTIPVLKGNFPGSTLDPVVWTETSSNSATVTVADGMAELASGTNSAGSTSLQSVGTGRFEAGQVTVFQSGVRAGAGLAGNTRIWGLRTPDGQEGLYFKWSGTTFQVVALKAGSETAVDSDDFNGESTWTPIDANNTYRIEYSAGRAIFYRASGGQKVLLHQLVNTAEPLVNDLDLGLYYENTNSGNTTDVSMYVRGASSSVWGSLDRYNQGGAHIVAEFGTEVDLENVSGYEGDAKFGYSSGLGTSIQITNSATWVDLWGFGGQRTSPTSSFTPYGASDNVADTGIDIAYTYLDANGVKQTGTFTTDGSDGRTPVSLAVTATELTRAFVDDSTALTGDVTITTANNFTNGVPDNQNEVLVHILAEDGGTQVLANRVPANTRLVPRGGEALRIDVVRQSGAAGSVNAVFETRETGKVWRVRRQILATVDRSYFDPLAGIVLSAGTDWRVRIRDVSDSSTFVAGVLNYDYVSS